MNEKRIRFAARVAISALLLWFMIEAPASAADLLYFSGGETGALQQNDAKVDGWRTELHADHEAEAVQFVSSPVRAGDKAIRIYYADDWGRREGKIRSEVKRPGGIQLKLGQEYWIGFSIFLKENANNRALIDTSQQNCHCMQWHFIGDRGTSGINMRHGKWQVSFGASRRERPVKDIQLGVWNDFVMHVKLSSGSDGFWKLWINKQADDPPDVSITGRTAVSDLNPKMGIYRHDFDDPGSSYAELFYDEYRIAGADAGFNDVAPGERTGN